MHENQNLFVALREGFPAELDGIAIETADGPGAPLFYTWRDIERATAMIAWRFTPVTRSAQAGVKGTSSS